MNIYEFIYEFGCTKVPDVPMRASESASESLPGPEPSVGRLGPGNPPTFEVPIENLNVKLRRTVTPGCLFVQVSDEKFSEQFQLECLKNL